MAIEDLDLEFEDEAVSDKGDALNVDVDLSFSASPDEAVRAHLAQSKSTAQARPAPKPVANQAPGAKPTVAPKKTATNNNVADIGQARTQNRQATPQASPALPQARPTQQVQNQSDYANVDHGEIAELRAMVEKLQAQVTNIQQQANIKVAVAQAEKDYMVEFISNAKVMDHQVTQILSRINKKVPALSSEVQTIKKYVTEFLKKSHPDKKKEG